MKFVRIMAAFFFLFKNYFIPSKPLTLGHIGLLGVNVNEKTLGRSEEKGQ